MNERPGNPLLSALRRALEQGASDLHAVAGRAPVLRRHKQLVPQDDLPVISDAALQEALRELIGEAACAELNQQRDLDRAVAPAGLGRFRLNAHFQLGALACAFRAIADRVPALETLGLPDIVPELARRRRGLVLVTGVTGSGKSTTLAAMLDLINRERAAHIITLEDPIEYLHPRRRALIEQREIGSDCPSFAQALRSVLRQDPDVILVGELRDEITITAALTAAETGHLVLGTLHTLSAAQTVERIIDACPAERQHQVRLMLAQTLEGVICQALLPRQGGGVVAAAEVLVATAAVRSCIRENELHQIPSLLQTGRAQGMQTLDHALKLLVLGGQVEPQEAMTMAMDPAALERALGSPTKGTVPAPTKPARVAAKVASAPAGY